MPELSYASGRGAGGGYLAVPDTGAQAPGAPWPGVIVIHEAFGLTNAIRRHADDFAGHGYLAFAPDLYGGRSWVRCVTGAIGQLRAASGPAFTAIESARSWLASRPDCTGRTGVIGFCMGGGFALLCAPRDGFAVVSVNYGDVPRDAERALAGACPVIGSYGARDPMGVKPAERLEQALTSLNVPHDIKIYPGAGHRFMTPGRPALAPLADLARMGYRQDAADDAWQRILAFFGERLRG
jgi:carboxymethylenebutenolidase